MHLRVPQVLVDEGLAENAQRLGETFRREMRAIPSERVSSVRGRGLLNAVVIKNIGGVGAWDVCLALRDRGLLAKPTHGDTIRFAPPLVLNDEQMAEATGIIRDTIVSFDK